MNDPRPFGGISGSTLKLIAIVTMFIDHLGATVLRTVMNLPSVIRSEFWSDFWQTAYSSSRNIGRIAFPIFCFLIVEGFIHTRNVWKYASRMFLFALISEIPFDIALKGNWYHPMKQNVYFTLLIGLLVLIGIDAAERLCQKCIHKLQESSGSYAPVKTGFMHILSIAASVLIIWAGMRLAAWIDTDYNFKGVFLIAVLYIVRRCEEASPHIKFYAAQANSSSEFHGTHTSSAIPGNRSRLLTCFAGAMAVSWELPAPLGFIPVYLYNGTRGLRMKYFFYWFYPVHLLILHVIADYLIPAI